MFYAGGLTAGTIVTGFQQGDTSKAAHAIADSSSNGQASDALGQLYHNGEKSLRCHLCIRALLAMLKSRLITLLAQYSSLQLAWHEQCP